MKRLVHSLLLLPIACLALVGGPLHAQLAEVWPGDANANGTVSHVDLLYWGRWFGETGPARDSISINWTVHTVPKWAANVTALPDPSHADCNGDSTVDFGDLVAIDVNYGLDNQSNLPDLSSLGSTSTNASPLTLSIASGVVSGGMTDTLWISLGDSAHPVDSLLGFATTLSFDSTLVDSAYAFFDGSWLGDPAQDLTTLDRYRPGELDLAATRTDRTDQLNRYGRVGGVVIVMTENLKREVQITSTDFAFSQALALTSGIQAVPVTVERTSVPVFAATQAFEVLVYPNPATEWLQLEVLAGPGGPLDGRLMDSRGRIARKFQVTDRLGLDRDGLRSGIYLLELRSGESVFRKRIVFLE